MGVVVLRQTLMLGAATVGRFIQALGLTLVLELFEWEAESCNSFV